MVLRAGVPAADADDVTQEVMLAIHRSASSFRVPQGRDAEQARAAWCQGVVRLQVATYRRARGTEPSTPCADADAEGSFGVVAATAESRLMQQQALSLALDILAVLGPRVGGVFVGYVVLGKPMKEVAAELGAPVHTGWNLLRRARAVIESISRRRRAEERRCPRRPHPSASTDARQKDEARPPTRGGSPTQRPPTPAGTLGRVHQR